MKRFLVLIALGQSLLCSAVDLKSSFESLPDTLSARIERRTGVKGKVELNKVMKRGNQLDLYFTKDLVAFPWRRGDAKWLRKEVINEFPAELCEKYNLGFIYAKDQKIDEVETPVLNCDGKAVDNRWKARDPGRRTFIERDGARRFPKGLDGRFISVYQSHGRFWSENDKRWEWQRPQLFGTVEDMYTQSYVIPFLIPMLENAGGFAMSPRETDTGSYEVVCDNDRNFGEERQETVRKAGSYEEKGRWSDAGTGFADLKESYCGADNPFLMGTARKASVSKKANASVIWAAAFPGKGRRSVYVSYKSLPQSSSCARYTVSHLGGCTTFFVDQRMGGGTWIKLGEFEFGTEGSVTLDNSIPQGRSVPSSSVVTADAVRFGGGMGKVTREGVLSGLPAYAEGASYHMLWSGFGREINHGWDTDYTSDYAGRGLWVQEMRKRGVPFDLSLAFHTDAGLAQGDTTIGTLTIYSLKCDGKKKTSSGVDRMSSRLLADFVQTQLSCDVQTLTRRETADRSYSESRTTDTPAIILELLSHQNFADMRLGLDPRFRFTASRAVYKGILKFLASLYGCEYVVQPLPVRSFSARLTGNGKVRLSWAPTEDALEPTAAASGYTVYTRIDDGGFDEGREVKGTSVELPISKGHIYSYRVCAWNDGGLSFPSETLCAYEPETPARRTVLIVNGFTDLRGPKTVDTPEFAGMLYAQDYGVPYIEDIHYIGPQYNFDRCCPYMSNAEPGFGACYGDYVPGKVAGNTFDFPYMHGRVLKELGYAFSSESAEAFVGTPAAAGIGVVDVIFGKQLRPLTSEFLTALGSYAASGAALLISGQHIASERCSDPSDRILKLLGYRFSTTHASRDGKVGEYRIAVSPNPERMCVEAPEGIRPAGNSSSTILNYHNENYGAGVFYDNGSYRSVCYAFPLESLEGDTAFRAEFSRAIKMLIE